MIKSSSPLIGIPCRHDTSNNYAKELVNVQSETYLSAISQAGGIPLLIPLNLERAALRTLYDLAAGILLTGGGDIDPALYGQEPHAKLVDVQADRDREEITISRWAMADGKPLFGICRGVQVIVVAAGGALCQDIPSLMPQATLHNYAYRGEGSNGRDCIIHEVELTPSCRLSQILQTKRLKVNSLHHQAVESVPEPFQIVGRSTDGVIEVVELPGHPFYCGVQWHPEILVAKHETSRRTFRGFVEICGG